jgi:hypothetical protein
VEELQKRPFRKSRRRPNRHNHEFLRMMTWKWPSWIKIRLKLSRVAAY